MSSKIVLPGDQRLVGPVPWRNVGTSAVSSSTARTATDSAAAASAQLAQVEAQYQQKVRESHAAGLREGEIAGRNRAAADLQPVIERLAHSIQEIANMRPRLRKEAEGDVVKLALAIAHRVIRREMASDPDALRGLVTAALDKLAGQEVSRVKVHPSHAATVKSCLDQFMNSAVVEVVSDSSRELGTVVFETARGNLDASVDSQLQEIERGLTDRLRKPA
jgi:flagellar assembly protein FliH